MRMPCTDVAAAVEHLPPAAVLTLDDVSWEGYELILEEFDERPALRITYDQGRLDIVTTSRAHERRHVFISRMICAIADELNIDVEGIGGTTEKSKRHQKGTEPDASFYIGSLERTIGKEELNLETDAPPDLVIEIDKSNQSLRKLPIYAAFGVPEVWRYVVRGKKAEICQLIDKTYVECSASRFFPVLTTSILARFVEQSAAEGQPAALKAFRRWLKTQK
jgi:Uma2 family endonuclease